MVTFISFIRLISVLRKSYLEKNNNEPPRNKVGMFLLGTGGGSTLKNDNYKFHTMVVNSWDSLRAASNMGAFDKLVDSLLYECRTKKNSR